MSLRREEQMLIDDQYVDNSGIKNDINEYNSAMGDFADLRAFIRVVDRRGFAAASKGLGLTPSAVSKLVTRLEDRLGVRLFHRTTRRLLLTPEGETYHLRARDIISAVEDAEAEISHSAQRPRGKLRVNCVPAFAFHQLAKVLPAFAEKYPEIELDLTVTDRVIDLLAEDADVAIRTGVVDSPSLIVRKISEVTRGLYASPAYLARRGTPQTPEQLSRHNCIVLKIFPASSRWPFHKNGKVRLLDIGSRLHVDSGEAALRLAVADGGIARLANLIVADAVRAGELNAVLEDCHVAEPVPLSAVYPQGRHRMPKVRVFVDFLTQQFGHGPWLKN